MAKLAMKRWVFEQLLSKLERAKKNQDFSQALGAINTVVTIASDHGELCAGGRERLKTLPLFATPAEFLSPRGKR